MHPKFWFLTISLASTTSLAQAAPSEIARVQLPAAVTKASARLTQLKQEEEQEKWDACAKTAARIAKQEPLVRGWVAGTWLRCARKAEQKSGATVLTRAAVTGTTEVGRGPWAKSLQTELVRARFQVAEADLKKKNAALVRDLDWLLENLEGSDRDGRAKAYALYGDWAQSQRDAEAALRFYEQSLAERENRSVRDRASQMMLALNQSKASTPSAGEKEEYVSEAEKKFEDRFNSAQKNNDLVALVEDAVTYLNKYPHGKKAKWAHDRVLDLYLLFQDQALSGEEKWVALRDRTLALMEKVEWSRQGDWARLLHRRSDFVGSLRLAEKAIAQTGTTSWNSILLYVAGRSAQMLGEDRKAQKYFESYVEGHSAGDEIAEVMFRLGLTYLRQDQPASAVAIFERLLSLRNKDRYELSARYWMIRSLQSTQSPRVATEIDSLIQKFPFSYYGLKLRAETNEGMLEWPLATETPPSWKARLPLAGPQKKAWDRIQLLAASGWRSEALTEILAFPNPEDPQLKALLAQQWSQAQAYPVAIKLINEITDDSVDFRGRDFVKLGLPKDYSKIVEAEAKRQGLGPVLVWSLIRQESAFNPRAVSSSNALGLMQLIPPTAKEVAQNLKLGPLDLPDDAFNPDRNIPMGTSYLAQMVKQFQGSVPLGLAAYNAGPTRMETFVRQRPALREQIIRAPQNARDEMWMDELPWFETSFYVKAILRNTLLYRLLDQRRVKIEMVVWKDLWNPALDPTSGPSSASVEN